jgi:stage II sporulation protein D
VNHSPSPTRALLVGVALLLLCAAACRTPAPRRPEGIPTPPPTRPASPTPEPGPAPPTVRPGTAPPDGNATLGVRAPRDPSLRIGLSTDALRSSLGADSGVLVFEGSGQRLGGPPSSVQRATFVLASAAEPLRRFRVQVASLADEAAAQRVGQLAASVLGEPASVRLNSETATFQVRVGRFVTREEAQAAGARLRHAGLAGTWIADEPGVAGAGGRLRLLETGQEFESVTVAPAVPEEFLRVDAGEYRGLVELRATPSGRLAVINWVNFEDYLRGVVPNELSPSAFPQVQALEAQAVAARTYAWRNRGQFAAQGYDLCATPSCQVYKGKSSEHALTDEAVAATSGIIATHAGRPIQAFYTSTCGGHTEDGANIFEGEGDAYLRGVACVPEQSAWTLLRSTAALPVLGAREGLGRAAALLTALGVIEPRRYAAGQLDGPAREGELQRWLTQLVGVAQRRPCDVKAPAASTQRAGFWRLAVGRLCWDERAERLLAPHDPDFLLHVADRDALHDVATRRAAALLVHEGLLSADETNRLRPDEPLTRADAVLLLAGLAEKLAPPALVQAQFRGHSAGRLELLRGELAESYALDGDVRLFRSLENQHSATAELSLVVGDDVTLVAREGRVLYLEAQQSRAGPSADRSSRYFRWEVRATPEQLAKAVTQRVGPLLDVQPRRFGVSGRVVELALVGRDGEQLLRGLKIRSALGLRENLFVIDRERGPDGLVQRFVFTGKGWGHGVGLCQVGAFGMAQAGATHEAILKHYYTGIRLERAY